MTPGEHEKVEELFQAALDLPPEERTRLLDEACRDDRALRSAVEELLASERAASRFFERPAASLLGETGPARAETLAPGQRVGSFAVVDLIGTGGMGAVYKAVQDRPHRTVALKVLRPGTASEAIIRRFRYEAEILARLRHPGIAHVYEAGVHVAGYSVPYFAMEYVPEAKTLNEYADARGLRTRERLELFARVCDAVQHGHQRGVIHRDLKPSNILVDASGQPKVIDFGVARATDADIAATTALTDVGTLVGTLPYMSPEQCDGDPGEIDTRSDVYALGVVLFELLCGRLPYDLGKGPLTHAVRVIKEVTPTRPSSLNKVLRGDVETIVLKALEKDRDRRYASAEVLAQDIRRYLQDEPIAARPPSALYQLRKLVRRHKVPAALLAALLAVVPVFAVASWVQAARVARERDKANGVAKFLTGMLEGADPDELGHQVTGKMLVDRAVAKADLELAGQPEVEEAVREVAARAYLNLGQLAEAEREWRKAEALLRRLVGPDDPGIARVQTALAGCLHLAQRPREAEPILREALALERRLGTEESPEGLATRVMLGNVLRKLGQIAEAEAVLLDALHSQERTGAAAADRSEALEALGTLYYEKREFATSRDHYAKALEAGRACLPRAGRLVSQMNGLANVLMNLDERDQAEKLWTEGLEILERRYPPDHPSTVAMRFNLAIVREFKAEFAEAEALFAGVVAARRAQFGSDKPVVATALARLGSVLAARGKSAEAEAALREALDIHLKAGGAENPAVAQARGELSFFLLQWGRLPEAEKEIEEASRIQGRVLPAGHPGQAATLLLEGKLKLKQGKHAEAEKPIQAAIAIREKALGTAHWQTQYARAALAECWSAAGRHAEAEPLLLAAHDAVKRSFAPSHPRTIEVLEAIVALYEAWGKPERAAERRQALPASRP